MTGALAALKFLSSLGSQRDRHDGRSYRASRSSRHGQPGAPHVRATYALRHLPGGETIASRHLPGGETILDMPGCCSIVYWMKRVLVACEFSGIVRDAFLANGCDAYSCDLLQSERSGPHLQRDVCDVLGWHWDLIVAFPPCTYLCSSGARWWKNRRLEQEAALALVQLILNADCPAIVLENPVGLISTRIRRPEQIIQPWQFGHGETKTTCLWLKGVPKLRPTCIVSGRIPRVHWISPGNDRWRERSRTLPGVAAAMAAQWS